MIGPELTDQASYTVRQFIALWGHTRRTAEAIEAINADLAQRGIVVQPDFTTVRLDDLVRVREQAPAELSLTGDLTWRVGNVVRPRHVACGRLDDPLSKAFGLMVAHEYSQLPVLDAGGRLHGVITWESIARAQSVRVPRTVADAAQTLVKTAREDDELFGRIEEIKQHGFLVIVGPENTVRGIVTASDLAGELRDRIEPFTVLEEIERRLRRAVSVLSVEDLRQVWSESSNRAARITSASDLTLGNYRYLLADEDRWEKLAWPFERDDFIARLEGVTRFRNSVAHWSIDAPGRESGELAAAKQFLNMLKVVDCG